MIFLINKSIIEAKSLKGTNTWLNSDVEKSKDKIIDKKTREELGNLSTIFWQDHFFLENTNKETSFVEEEKYRNYYEGYTHIQFPYFDLISNTIHSAYYMHTSRTSGHMKTPWYGEPFNEDKFEYMAFYHVLIYFPTNLLNITQSYPGLTFVMHFYMDVALFEGYEEVKIKKMGKTGDTYWYDYYGEYFDVVHYPDESLFKTGNVSLIKKYDASNFQQGEKVWIYFDRVLEKALVDKSPEKRNTGFELTWYYEDEFGTRVDIEEESKFEGKDENQKFVAFMNLIFEAISKHSISLETLWETAKHYRLDYTHRRAANKVGNCNYWTVTTTDDYLDYFSSVLGIAFNLQDQPVYKDEISDYLLSEGWQLFHYVARCQDMYQESMDTFKKYINAFNKDSAVTILEAASVINNMERKLKEGRNMWEKTSASRLMEKMNEIFGLNIYKLEIFSSTGKNNEDIRDVPLKKKLETCLKEDKCEELKGFIMDQGSNSIRASTIATLGSILDS